MLCSPIEEQVWIERSLMTTNFCSFEDDAEQMCEKYLLSAAEMDPSDPEVYQVRANSLFDIFRIMS